MVMLVMMVVIVVVVIQNWFLPFSQDVIRLSPLIDVQMHLFFFNRSSYGHCRK